MLLASVVLAILVYGIIASMLGSLLPSLGFTGQQNGMLAVTQASGLTLAALSAGPLIDIRGRKVAMSLGLGAMALALWLLPAATGKFALMTPLWFLLGLGGGVMGTASNSLLSDIGGADRSSVLNYGNVFYGVGLMVTPYLASSLFAGDMRGLCFFAATLATVMLGVYVSLHMPLPNTAVKFSWREAGLLLRSPAMHWFALYAFLYVGCEVGLSNWLVKYLIGKGIAREHALKILSLGFAFGLLSGRMLASRILKRASGLNVILGAAIAMTVTTLWMLGSGPGELSAVLSVFCVGLSMAAAFPTTLGLAIDVFPNATGTAIGLVTTAGWAGLAVSSQIIGAVAGSDEAHLSRALLVFPVFSAIMIGVSLAMRGTLRRLA